MLQLLMGPLPHFPAEASIDLEDHLLDTKDVPVSLSLRPRSSDVFDLVFPALFIPPQ